MKLRIVLAGLLVGLLAFAQPAQAAKNDYENYVRSLGDKVLAIIQDKSASDAKKEEQLKTIFIDVVGVEWMGKFSMGKYYRQASDAQKKKYMQLYERFLVASYIPRFKEYAGEAFNITGSTDTGNGDMIVHTLLTGNPDKPQVKVDYRLRKLGSGDKIQVIDVIGEGVSLITTQRSDFGGMISREGLDAFINALEGRVSKLETALN